MVYSSKKDDKMNKCLNCNKETLNPKFCSNSCSAKINNKLNPKRKKTAWKTSECKNCEKSFNYRYGQSQGLYCSNYCQHDFQKKELIKSWLSSDFSGTQESGRLSSSIRNYLIEKANYSCSQCGWNKINLSSGRCPLEIDHIDGNSENCRPENLRVLCPNCHSLTPTWKALNSGKGSKKRLQYGKLI